MYPSIRPVLRVLLLAAILTLLIAGINVANLLLLRSKKRELDTAIRLALGARFRHLARPVMTEALLIGALSATFALLATHFALNALLSRIPSSLYEDTRLGIGRRVAIFTFTMGLAAGLAISLAGARSLLRTHPRSLLAPQSHWSLRGRFVPGQTIVILQVALALPLVVGVITVGRAFLSITNQPLGFVHTNVIKISMTPDLAEGNDRQRLYLQVLDTLRQRADVLAAGAAGSLPLDGTAPDEGLQSVANPAVRVGAVHVLPGFFEAVGIPLIKGRLLHSADARSSFGAVVINHAAARALFSTRNPLGETFRTRSGRMVTVVGVVGDATSQIGRPPMPLAYLLPADNTRSLSLLVHVPNRQEALLADIRREVSAVATGTPISATWWTDDIRTLRVFSHPRFQMLVFGTFACFSLAVTALGMYVLLGYLGELRTHEFGVRLAIGASPSSVQRLMIRDAVTSSAFGLGIGLFGALWLGGLASATLPGSTIGAWPVISSCVVVLLAACTGALIPAVRAGRLDPAQLLRVS
jgi:predicted permease